MKYIVSQDGRGDYRTIQAAVDAVDVSSREGAEIFIRCGEYRERVVLNKPGLRVVGEDAQKVVITHSACAKDQFPDGAEKGTFLSFTLLSAAPDVTVENLTVRNDAGDGRVVGQAVAVYAAGDRGIWRNCRLIACQDTLFCGPLMPKVAREVAPLSLEAECVEFVGDCPPTRSRQYFEDCFIQGDVDYIFGPYRCWFERCTLYMNARGGWYTAANTPEEQPWGLVFHRCRLTGECVPGMGYLGRPWRKYARTLFIDCDMDEHVSPLGFVDWDEIKLVTDRLGEWGTTGARADQSTRHPMQKRMTQAEAQRVTPAGVLSGWDPARGDGAGEVAVSGLDRWRVLPLEGNDAFLTRFLSEYRPYKRYWNYEDGCVLKGCIDLYRASGKPVFRDLVLSYLDRFVLDDGSIPNFPLDSYNIDSINCGKALFFALDETGEERYRKALDFHAQRLSTHPRCACGNFWHKQIYPEQIWLDGLYMAQPFRVEYLLRFGDPGELGDVAAQFENVRRYLYDADKGLYYHACDMAKQQPWADPQTGCSANFWLRSMGWYLMALVDCWALIGDWVGRWKAEQLRQNGLWVCEAGSDAPRPLSGADFKNGTAMAFSFTSDAATDERIEAAEACKAALGRLFVEAAEGIVRWRDEKTGLYWQVIDRADVEGNYLETSGSAMVLYALMKGDRLGLIQCDRMAGGVRPDLDFERLTLRKLRCDPCGSTRRMYEKYCEKYAVDVSSAPQDGEVEVSAAAERTNKAPDQWWFRPDGSEVWRLHDICKVAGLGPGEKRDGSVEYYLSEPRVADDAKGVGPWMMALSEYLRLDERFSQAQERCAEEEQQDDIEEDLGDF